MPSNPYPVDGAIKIPIDVMLLWDGGDPDNGDNVTCDVYLGIGTDMRFYKTTSIGRCETKDLKPATTYRWKVIIKDNHDASTEGPVWTFTTQKRSLCAAEAIYGENAEQTELLREYRDNVLSKTSEGQETIKTYYKFSPTVTKLLESNQHLKNKAKAIIDSMLPGIRKKVEESNKGQ
jgi:hypothetical protein